MFFLILKKKYAYIEPEKIIKHYEYEIEYYKYQKRWQKSDPNFVPLVKKLSLQYSEASIQNRKIIEKRTTALWTANILVVFFAIFLLSFYILVFLKNISFYEFLANIFYL